MGNVIKNLTVWQNYAHYLLLTGCVFFIHWLTDIWGIERLVIDGVPFAWFVLFMFYAIGIFIADTLIHLMFSILPKPFKWDD